MFEQSRCCRWKQRQREAEGFSDVSVLFPPSVWTNRCFVVFFTTLSLECDGLFWFCFPYPCSCYLLVKCVFWNTNKQKTVDYLLLLS